MSDSESSGGIDAPAPLTFEQAFAADASPAPDPGSSAVDATAAGQPTQTEPSTTTQAPGEPDREPFIPRARFDEVNTERNELKAWRDSRAWAEHLDGQAFQQLSSFYGRAVADPRSFALHMLDQLAASPEHGPLIRSELARRLGTRQSRESAPSAAAEGMPEPDVAITDANGQEVSRTYSAQQLAKRDAYLRSQLLAEIKADLGPQFQTINEIRQQRATEQAQQAADTFAKTATTELSTLPHFDQHKAEIGQALKAMGLESDHPSDVKAALYKAYWQVVGPKLQNGGTTPQGVLADLQRKAHASSTVHPGRAASSAPRAPRSFAEIPADQW